jgi:hypothetical protein
MKPGPVRYQTLPRNSTTDQRQQSPAISFAVSMGVPEFCHDHDKIPAIAGDPQSVLNPK